MHRVHVAIIVEALNHLDGKFYILLGEDHQGLHQLPGGPLKTELEQPRFAAARHLRHRIKQTIVVDRLAPLDPLIYQTSRVDPKILIASFGYRWEHNHQTLPPVSNEPCKEISSWQWHAEEDLASKALHHLPITQIHQGALDKYLNRARASLAQFRSL